MILFNGSTGSLGRYLGPALSAAGVRNTVLHARVEDREGTRRELAGIATEAPPPGVCLVHLAAKVSVPQCERDPAAAEHVNVACAVALAEDFARWAASRGQRASLVYVSTGHVYAAQPPGSRCREGDPLGPRSVYARSKALAEEALSRLAADLGMHLVVARVFGLIAPVQPPSYVLQGLIRRARAGDVSAVPGAACVRDYLDSRDVCRILVELAARSLAERPLPPVLNVCSGEGVSIRAMLEQLLLLCHGGAAGPLLATLADAPGRPDDPPWIVGDPTLLAQVIPDHGRTIRLAQTLEDALRAT